MYMNNINWDDVQESTSSSKCNEGPVLFEITGVEEKTSKSGNQMTVVEMNLFDKEGNSNSYKEYLVQTDSSLWKIKIFMKAIGKYELLKNNKLIINEIIGERGIAINEYRPVEKTNEMGEAYIAKYCSLKKYNEHDKEKINSFLPRKASEEFDDDIPF